MRDPSWEIVRDFMNDRDWAVANPTVLDGMRDGEGFVAAVTDRDGGKFIAIRLSASGSIPACAVLDMMDLLELQDAINRAVAAHGGREMTSRAYW